MKKYIARRMQVIVLVVALMVGMMSNVCVTQAKVKLSNKSLKLTVGSIVTLKVTGTKKKVKWSSNKKLVASVTSKGKVKARKPGKATITARVGDNKYKCKITVVKKSKTTKQDTTTEQQITTEQHNSTERRTSEDKTPQSEEKQTDIVVTTEKETVEEKTTAEDNTAREEKVTTEEGTTEATTETTTGNNSPSSQTQNYDAGEYTISFVHSGEGTYYEPTAGGASNLDDFATENGYYTAAMNNYDYMNGMAGAYVEITDKDGDKIKVLITDRLPEGAKGDIDLKPDAFALIEPQVTGRMPITWRIIPLPTDDPIQYVFKPTSTQYWAEVQIRNHRYPIKKVEYLDASTNTYKEMERMEYNYFRSLSGLGSAGPYTFRVTDIYGHQLIDTGIAINSTSTPVNGAANFPY